MGMLTDFIDPIKFTEYARASLTDYERSKGTLAQYLPNRTVNDTVVEFDAKDLGLVPAAKFRALDAEPDVGTGVTGKRVKISLATISEQNAISEFSQIRSRNADDPALQNIVYSTLERTVTAIAEGVEIARGVVIATGKATIDQDNYKSADDFGRDPGFTTTASKLWSASDSDPISYLRSLVDLYADKNGERPGVMLTSTSVMNVLQAHPKLAAKTVDGSLVAATIPEVNARLAGYGLPEVRIYDRRVNDGTGTGKPVLPVDRVFLLPAPVDPNGMNSLGATVWGTSLGFSKAGINVAGLAPSTDPMIFAGIWEADKIPFITEVFADAMVLPILVNPNLSLAAKVL